jgi:hypothetical protein
VKTASLLILLCAKNPHQEVEYELVTPRIKSKVNSIARDMI